MAVPRQNLVQSWNELLADELDAAYFDKILVMILAIVTSLRHLLGWVVSAFRSRAVSVAKTSHARRINHLATSSTPARLRFARFFALEPDAGSRKQRPRTDRYPPIARRKSSGFC